MALPAFSSSIILQFSSSIYFFYLLGLMEKDTEGELETSRPHLFGLLVEVVVSPSSL